jgi:Family of unknown function (DUF6062)
MVTPLSYFDLVETFAEPGCALCNLLLRDADRFLDSLLYEHVTDPDIHRKFRASRGLCNEHSWQLIRHKGNSLGIAVLYGAVIDEVMKLIDQPPRARRSLADRLEPTGPCMACRLLADAEKRFIQVLIEYIADPKLDTAYRASDGLCLPHFRETLRQTRDLDRQQTLLAIQKAIWSRLRTDLEEFEAKNDYRRIHEPMGTEGNSWVRAIGAVVGAEGVFGVNPRS